jgi:hypothetical protein
MCRDHLARFPVYSRRLFVAQDLGFRGLALTSHTEEESQAEMESDKSESCSTHRLAARDDEYPPAMRAAYRPIASTIANEISERFEYHADISSAAGKRVSTSLVKNMAARAIGPH